MSTFTISLPEQIAVKVDQATLLEGFATRSEFIRNLIRRYLFPETKFEVFKPRPLTEIKAGFKATGKYNQKFINSVIKGLEKSSFYGDKAIKV
ncbi:hypothetical protein COW80_03665 [Candidatus Beckwithbacteria bacterium CG22_combo_CG10-13_8_21_14_all_01_47_9]|uniref:Ribbon-helix-helix protein CopG domain-containing protein n=2 Tax=Candidatus Beckwithiibacteriota TaxID=1752726 RepID=A0A2H0E082_9BACT|nr:MAG: hypothetical protein COW80_03665 [Candidatus Beckwithbacteria bacterium CG22_combo_CG10-13_8_21_14_all_01_47_9]PJC66018.1 MAG: hypothetical protein CO018_04095 [Candidatus Beckwithbacteria bacterium CG_4_9_14_0_2_um_filter_47_11]